MMSSYANTAYQGNFRTVAAFPRRRVSVRVTEPSKAWREAVIARLDCLIRLERGWDGYEGMPVSFANATFALRMLESACGDDAPVPEIVPGADGDLQIEWHLAGEDIELHVRGPNDVIAWRMVGENDPDGEEIPLTNDFTIVVRWIENLAEREIATGTAAA
jgi:hypothetical protein